MKSLPFLPLFYFCLLVYDCIVKSLPFLTTFSLLSVCVRLHCEITAVYTTFLLLSACVWLHCKIAAVFYHFFTFVRLCMIALWNHCRFYHLFTFVRLFMIALWNHCRFLPLFHFCTFVYDCIVKSRPFLTTFSLLSVCVWLHCEITAVVDHFFAFVRLCMIALWNHCRFYHFFTFVRFFYDCVVKSLPFLTTFSLLSVCVWLHCEITAVFDHFFTFVRLCMLAPSPGSAPYARKNFEGERVARWFRNLDTLDNNF